MKTDSQVLDLYVDLEKEQYEFFNKESVSIKDEIVFSFAKKTYTAVS